tara:strand:- start:1740 stop:3041 length:1302 start_codon:yes stop_codon:yes gene_type:complete
MLPVEKSIHYRLVLILTWFSFFFSINLNPLEFLEYDIISKTRLILPLIFIFLIIFFKYKEIKFSDFISIHSFLFYSIFFLYIFFNLITPQNNNINIFWPLYMFLSFLLLHIFTNYEEKKILLILTSIIILIGFIFFFIFALTKMYIHSSIHFYGIYGASMNYGGFESPPRSSGLSRLSLLTLALITFYYLINKKKSYFLLLLISFFALTTLVFQSRTTSFIFIIFIIFVIIFYFKSFFYDKRLIIFILILPLLFNSAYQFLLFKYEIVRGKNITITSLLKDSLLRDTMSYPENKFIDTNKRLNKFTSDRLQNWKDAIDIVKNDYLKGYGAQADRILINQSIHNAIIYSILSGGILAGIALISIYIYSIFLLTKFYFFTKYKLKFDFLIHFSGSVLIILGLRSILETSFAVFSIDFLIYIITFLYFNNHLKKYQ